KSDERNPRPVIPTTLCPLLDPLPALNFFHGSQSAFGSEEHQLFRYCRRFLAPCLIEIDVSLDWNFIKEARDPLALALSREDLDMFRLHFAYICLYQVFEYHMEFLETFGCIWSSKESDCTKSLAFSHPETHIDDPGATSQSDLPRSLPIQSDPLERHTKVACDLSPGDTKNRPWSDFPERHLQVAPRYFAAENHDFLRTFLQFILDEDPLAVNEVEGLEGQEELCFINNNGSWYKKEPNFQYNNYQQKSYPNNQQSGYPPRNNQQGSYQPQQNPSSGSSAPQESITDTLLKQILESQTRSEKQVGYELKNLHSKIDGSYNELNNKFSHLASTYHMEFLETFGCIWSSKEVIRVVFGRALPGATSRSDGMRSLCTTSRSDSSRATAQSRSPTFQSDVLKSLPKLRATLPERQGEVARHFGSRKHEIALGATSRSDPARSLPKPRATCWSDLPRSLRVAYLLEFMFSQGPFCHFIMHVFYSENLCFNTRKPPRGDYLVLRKTTKNLWKGISLNELISLLLRILLSEYLHSRCFDIPQNWFNNHLYYNICLMSLENS
ncbi:hypothetical protein IGI04_026898, partial [Brassica rapa subsp. trilocularis]